MEPGVDLLLPTSSSPLLFFDGHLFLLPPPLQRGGPRWGNFPCVHIGISSLCSFCCSSYGLFFVVGHVSAVDSADVSSVVVGLFVISVVSAVVVVSLVVTAVAFFLLGLLIFFLLKPFWRLRQRMMLSFRLRPLVVAVASMKLPAGREDFTTFIPSLSPPSKYHQKHC